MSNVLALLGGMPMPVESIFSSEENTLKCANCGHDAPKLLQGIECDHKGQHMTIVVVCQKCSRCGMISFDDANAKVYGNAVKAFQSEVDLAN